MEETTENKPRSLRTLLTLDTYQGMTDEEINLVLDFWVDNRLKQGEIRERIEAYQRYTDALINQRLGIATMAAEAFDDALEVSNNFIVELQHEGPRLDALEPDVELLCVADEYDKEHSDVQ